MIVIKKGYTLHIRLIMLTIISLIATSGTYAKYTTTADTETAIATVATWQVVVNGYDITDVDEITFGIFDTIYDSNGTSVETDIGVPSISNIHSGGSNSLDIDALYAVSTSSGDEELSLIAPGTSGYFTFSITNYSQVNITYEFEFLEDNPDNIPVEFSLDKTNYFNIKDFTNELNNNSSKINMNNTKIIKIYWRWLFQGDGTNSYGQTDETDTALGTMVELPEYNLTSKIITTQCD